VVPGLLELLQANQEKCQVKKQPVALALCASLVCSPVYAKTFVGVLWPMFGPTFAPGLAELVAELKMMPDVEVRTYLHQSWPYLVQDIEHQPQGTHTVVVGYSLGANSSVFVANKAKYVDLIVALQPSMFSWNPSVTGNVGRMIEIYNPNPAMTFGGMGSNKKADIGWKCFNVRLRPLCGIKVPKGGCVKQTTLRGAVHGRG
jgi:hypothetical protein